jgi:hypothetical protein
MFQRIAAGVGQVYCIHPSQDLAGVYGQILSEFRSKYALAFYPKKTSPPRRSGANRGGGERAEGLTARTVSGVAARP